MTFPGDINALKDFLNSRVEIYNRPAFIQADPISIPHLFSKREDIEIMGFFASILAWGQRPTILNKCKELIEVFEQMPYFFILNIKKRELELLPDFKHRTFNKADLICFIGFLQFVFQEYGSLEMAFFGHLNSEQNKVEAGLNRFHKLFVGMKSFLPRSVKHISAPFKNSACKRLSMYLRWMVRKDKKGVDFGIWNAISPADLICPCDLHVDRVSRKLGLIQRSKTDWLTAVELTENLRIFDPMDPVKYDFALFGLGIDREF